MALWLPLIKASLPYVTQIVATAIPAFTAKPVADDATGQQIAELQSAVTQNAESIHVLAEKLQQTIQAMELAGVTLQKEIKLYRRLAYSSMAVSGVAILVALAAVLK